MKKLTFFTGLILISFFATGQGVAVNEDGSSADASSVLDVKSTTKGLLIPRMTRAEREAISSPATGLLVYQTDENPGIYCNSGTPGSPVWELTITVGGQNWVEDTANHYLYPASMANRIGIGTSAPAAALHVADSSVVFTGDDNISTTVEAPVTGHGTRMMWYPEKSAFRAGTLSQGIGDNFWNKDSIGWHSMALGTDVLALGWWSTALGNNTKAFGQYSMTSGGNTKAYGDYSIATGNFTEAKSPYSSVFGRSTQSNGYAGMVIGTYNDTLVSPEYSASALSPLFIVGNGSMGSRSNAMSVHYNGSAVFHGEYVATPDDPPATGAGTRMMWYPDKSALRAGTLHSGTGDTMWDKNNVGMYSMALGTNVMASGKYSTAFGFVTTASGDYATSAGRQVTASGDNSFAIGNLTKARAPNSAAFGRGTQANAYSSVVLGYFNDTVVSEEYYYTSTSPIFLIGNGQDINNRSNAMMVQYNGGVAFYGEHTSTPEDPPESGVGTRMMWYPDKAAFRAGHVVDTAWNKGNIGDYSFAAGYNPMASGYYSIALGSYARATGNNSISLRGNAQGNLSFAASGGQAVGDTSISIGSNNGVGNASVSIGSGLAAIGDHSVVLGFSSITTGTSSVAIGEDLEVNSYKSTAFGSFNVGGGSTSTWVDSDPLFELGSGSSDISRSNALTVLKNAKTGINTATPAEMLHVKGQAGEIAKVRLEGNTNMAVLEYYNGSSYGAGVGYSITNNNLFLNHNGNVVVKDGKLGIGTNTPQAGIHVDDDPVLFSGTYSGSPADPPASGAGTRMMWYPGKASFRAGYVATTEWDKSNIGDYSFAAGYRTIASGAYSVALGSSATASGINSIALDGDATANYAFAANTGQASGTYSFAASGGSAIGSYSVAMSLNEAHGNYSAAFGVNTDANAYASMAIGRYNANSGSTTSWVSGDPLLSVGNGTSTSNRSNAFTVLKNGKTGVNTATPAEQLHVKGISGTIAKIRIEGDYNRSALEFYNSSTYGAGIGYSILNDQIFLYHNGHVVVKDGNMGVGQNTITSGRKIDVSGGAYCSGTTWYNSSDRNLKENVTPVAYQEILEKIRGLDISYWSYSEEELDATHIGPMAQDFYNTFGLGFDETSISTVDADGVSFAAIKALAEENTELKNRLAELEERLEKLERVTSSN